MLSQKQMMQKKKHSKIGLFIRSLIFSIYSNTTIFFYSFVMVVSTLFPLHYRYMIIRSYLRMTIWMLRVVCHIDYKIEGLENIPKDRVGIVMCKHQSTWETFMLPLLFHDPTIIVKKELLWVPFFGWGLAAVKPIAINRNEKRSAMQQIIAQGEVALKDGRWIVVFPEGTRIPVGKMGKFKMGGARLATATGYPIIPIAHNAGYFWPRRKFIKQPGTITLCIGPLLETKGLTAEEALTFTKKWIENTMARIESFVDKSAG